jgi:hypothetical protein
VVGRHDAAHNLTENPMPRTPKLSDLQRVVLAHAAKRDDRHVLPLPASITDDECTRTQITGLIQRKLLTENEVDNRAPHWRGDGDHRIGLVVTAAGGAAIGIDLSDSKADRLRAEAAGATAAAPTGAGVDDTTVPRPASKRAAVIALLSQPSGATLADVCDQTGWLAHSARAFFTGLRKSGYVLERKRYEDVTRYVLTESANAER